jgi:hypothetical protein
MKRLLLLLALAVLGSAAAVREARAASGHDIADLWWNPAESGWGIQFVQQRDTVFATLFVYDALQTPTWFVATLDYQGIDEDTVVTYSGDLYAARGPWFGSAFNPTQVSTRRVGTMSFVGTRAGPATLTWSVDGVPVVKQIQRQSFQFDDLRGTYVGVLVRAQVGCQFPGEDGLLNIPAVWQVTQNGTATTIAAAYPGFTCTYRGNYSQSGRLGTLRTDYTCSTGDAGALDFYEITTERLGFMGRVVGQSNRGCSISGGFSGVR